MPTKIQWTNETWNPVRGCSRVSEGCRNCYAERQAARFARSIDDIPGPRVGQTHDPFHGFVERVNGHPAWTGKVELVANKLTEPLHWRKPKRIFVNSMSDLFHEKITDGELLLLFAIMANSHIATGMSKTHTFQILTKREERMFDFCSRIRWRSGLCVIEYPEEMILNNMPYLNDLDPWVNLINGDNIHREIVERPATWVPPQIWLGVSVEDQAMADRRIPVLLKTPAAKRFVSYEPALGPVDFKRFLPIQLDPSRYVASQLGDRSTDGFTDGTFPGLDWIIPGGESGPYARPCDIAWARNTIAQCKEAGVPCFVKQLGASPYLIDMQAPDGDWRHLDFEDGAFYVRLKDRKGGDWSEWPKDLRVREFPK